MKGENMRKKMPPPSMGIAVMSKSILEDSVTTENGVMENEVAIAYRKSRFKVRDVCCKEGKCLSSREMLSARWENVSRGEREFHSVWKTSLGARYGFPNKVLSLSRCDGFSDDKDYFQTNLLYKYYYTRGVSQCEGVAKSNPVISSFTPDCYATPVMTKRGIIPYIYYQHFNYIFYGYNKF